MTAQRTRPVGYAIWLIVASVVGWWAAFQLTLDKLAQLQDPDAALSCNFSVLVQCGVNLDSWQGSVFGFPNPIIGLTAWMAPLVLGVALLAGVRFPAWFWGLFGLGVAGAFAFVCWLITQSIYDLRTLCPWCMLTWAVTIPTFLATVVHLLRNGTLPVSTRAQERAGRLMVWVPLASIVAFALIIALAQLSGLDLLGELTRPLFR
ncbi:putative membrane protein [Microbacterium resistens]|uniref:Membrane protein n=1 Tax=Microbacterium resistens TaxID=156977 RepID=A0ABU1SFK4_9MICO|nr:vitamin K epoxide reductase family protein [Microbacterium resistens]MDR6868401.1 putative membrane protein [Microbacterium resistens]